MAALWGGFVSTLVPFPLVSVRDRQAFTAEASTKQLHHVFSSCHGRSQCDPKNMGENINIFFKKGNLLIH